MKTIDPEQQEALKQYGLRKRRMKAKINKMYTNKLHYETLLLTRRTTKGIVDWIKKEIATLEPIIGALEVEIEKPFSYSKVKLGNM